MRILECPEPSRNLLDNPITSFCIFPSVSFGWLYWTTHILLFPVNINHPSSCFLDAVHSVAQYLFCYLLADFKPSHFFDIPYTLTCSDSREVSKPFRLKNHTKLYCEDDNNEKYSIGLTSNTVWIERTRIHTNFIRKHDGKNTWKT